MTFQLPSRVVGDPEAQLNFEKLTTTIATLQSQIAALQSPAPTTPVTSLPSSPADGQEVSYLADATNGVLWRLKYDAASTYWRATGPELYAINTAHGTTTSTTYTASLTSGGTSPSLTAPLQGDYYIEHGALLYAGDSGTAANGDFTYQSISIASGTPSDNDAVVVDTVASGTFLGSTAIKVQKSLTATQTVQLQYKVFSAVGGHTGGAERRWLSLRPIRVK